jgi:hypothetical protein
MGAGAVVNDKAIQFNPPPDHHVSDLMNSINSAMASLPPDAKGALVMVPTTAGGNAAIVVRAGHSWDVMTWIGKSWGEPLAAGVAVRKVWY